MHVLVPKHVPAEPHTCPQLVEVVDILHACGPWAVRRWHLSKTRAKVSQRNDRSAGTLQSDTCVSFAAVMSQKHDASTASQCNDACYCTRWCRLPLRSNIGSAAPPAVVPGTTCFRERWKREAEQENRSSRLRLVRPK